MKFVPYWLDDNDRLDLASTGELPQRVDTLVIGAGFTGLSCAYELSRQGVPVAVVDAGKIAALASGRNGGHVNSGLGGSYRAVKARYGQRLAKEMYWTYDRAVALVEEIVDREGINCAFRRAGKLKAATKASHFEALATQYAEMRRDVDPDLELLGRDDIRSEVGTDAFYGGLLYRKSAQMHMGRYSRGLAECVRRQGGQLFEDTPVTAIDRGTGGGFRVRTSRGEVAADQVVLATGTSSAGPFGWVRQRIVPVGSFIIATEPLGEDLLAQIMPGRRNVTTTPNIGNYFRVLSDNRLLFGGRAKFTTSSPSADIACGAILRSTMLEFFPSLADVRIDYCWGGSVDMTTDRLPRTGVHGGIPYAMGYSGHGAQLSTLMGQHLAKVVMGIPERLPFEELAWPAIPGYFGSPWFLPFVGLYYQIKDRIS